MKYLYFDIECSNCFEGEGKVCEFGYVITDKDFNIIEKDCIPMCPGPKGPCRFDLSRRKNDPYFKFFHEPNYYWNREEFPHFYRKIKKLMCNQDTTVLGFSVDNDIRYLGSTIKRYNLEQIEYKAYDIQMILNTYSKEYGRFAGLEHSFFNLCDIKEYQNLTPHYSRDDAIMTMKVLKAMCNKLDFTLEELLKVCDNCSFNAISCFNGYLEKRRQKEKSKGRFSFAKKKMYVKLCGENFIVNI